MRGLLAYSGLSAKIKAMSSKLISDSEFREIASFTNVSEMVAFLKNHPAYRLEFQSADETALHRGEIEARLRYSVYNDYRKIYKFSNIKQREFMNLYFVRYEVSIIKNCMRYIFDRKGEKLDISQYQIFFSKQFSFDLNKIISSSTIDEFISNLKGSMYYSTLSKINIAEDAILFDYEMALDLFYFTQIWKEVGKHFKGSDLNTLLEAYGSKIDMLNIQWIYRSKKYYKMTPADIYAILIPIHYKLKKADIIAMAEAGSVDEMTGVLRGTYYAKHFSDIKVTTLEKMYRKLLDQIYGLTVRKNPYSIACVNTYLYRKEYEVTRLTTALEGIRYGLSQEEIVSYIF